MQKPPPEYLVIELNAALKFQLDALMHTGFGKSYADATMKVIQITYSKLSYGLQAPSTPNIEVDRPVELLEATKNANVKLSKRQKQLMPLINLGLTNNQIASMMNISEHTVKVHLWRLYQKLNTQNRTETVMIARMNGWL
jgi:DNA-binding NarL/FixJ family response regulator